MGAWSLGNSHLARLQNPHLILEVGEEGRKKREEAETKTVNFYYVSLQRMQRYKDDSAHARKDGQGLAECALSARPRPLWAPTRAAHGTATAQCACWGGQSQPGQRDTGGTGPGLEGLHISVVLPSSWKGKGSFLWRAWQGQWTSAAKALPPEVWWQVPQLCPLVPVGRSEMTGWASTAPRFHNSVRGGQPMCLAPGDRVLGAGQLGRRWGELPGISF